MKTLVRENGLSIVLIIRTLLAIIGQLLVGWHEFNNELSDYQKGPISFSAYLTSGHCIEAIFENWESNFIFFDRQPPDVPGKKG